MIADFAESIDALRLSGTGASTENEGSTDGKLTEIQKEFLEKPRLELEGQAEFFLTGPFTRQSCTELGERMLRRAYSFLNAQTRPTFQLTIYSSGGDLWACMYLASIIMRIRGMGYEVYTYVAGNAYSAGFILAQFGTHRIIDETATAHIHTIQMAHGYQPDVVIYRDYADLNTIDRVIIARIFANRNSKLYTNPEWWIHRYMDGREHFISAHQALDLGLVDEIAYSIGALRPGGPVTEVEPEIIEAAIE